MANDRWATQGPVPVKRVVEARGVD